MAAMDDGYHVIIIPAYGDDKKLATLAFHDAYDAYIVAQAISNYNHKTTQVIYVEESIDKRDLVWSFIDGQEVKWI